MRIDSLAAHARINLQMNRQCSILEAHLARGTLQFVELPGLPNHSGELMAHHILSLSRKVAADDKDSRLGANRARGHAFFYRGDAQPAGPGAHGRRSAKRQRVAVGIRFHDRQQICIGSREAREKAVIVFKGAGSNFNPAGACRHQGVQLLV